MRRNLVALVAEVESFVRDEVLPIEDTHDGDIERAGGDALRANLQARARERGILGAHAPVRHGGLGLNMVDRTGIFEAAGYSLFGPVALNIATPDEGNMQLLDHVATDLQRSRFLEPLVQGRVRSAFAMTEPAPGAGSDATGLATFAHRVDGGWLLSGDKHFITGADGAAFLIVMARTAGVPGDVAGSTMLLVPTDSPGLTLVRHVPTTDRSMIGGHCELTFSEVFVPDESVLGGVNEGFRYAQARVGPGRVTHVMRWTGAAQRAHDTALDYVLHREAFGRRLADAGMVHQMIADNEIDLAATRALLRRACEALDAGEKAPTETAIAKTFAAEALWRVSDRATQLCGGMGLSSDLPVARIAREIRPFRIYDGPSEVHRRWIARRACRLREAQVR